MIIMSLRNLIAAYTLLSRAERTGFIVLASLILLLLPIRLTLHVWVKPEMDPEREAALAAIWKVFCGEQAAAVPHEHGYAGKIAEATAGSVDIPAKYPSPVLFTFDPNTLDSAGFQRLGLRARTTRMLLNWRRKGKRFYKKEDLKPLYTLTEAEYRRLAPYIVITQTAPGERRGYQARPADAIIELNTADSQTLVRLRGIGPAIARRIIRRRAALGGFVDHEQLPELYRFNDTVMRMLRERLVISAGRVVRLNINDASAGVLARHPYISAQLAAEIVRLRGELGTFDSVAQPRQLPLMNAENYRKIAPYLTVH